MMPLKPGDIIAAGSPEGTGGSFEPPRWLEPGDEVEFEVPGIGILGNQVVDEQPIPVAVAAPPRLGTLRRLKAA